jgi:hypothetical protein
MTVGTCRDCGIGTLGRELTAYRVAEVADRGWRNREVWTARFQVAPSAA